MPNLWSMRCGGRGRGGMARTRMWKILRALVALAFRVVGSDVTVIGGPTSLLVIEGDLLSLHRITSG